MRVRVEDGARLVEAEMAVGADAEHLYVNVAALDDGVKLSDARVHITDAARDIGVRLVDVNMVKEIAVHEITVALVVFRGKADVLVKIHAVYAGEVQPLLGTAACQLLVHPDGAGACGQTKAAAGLGADDAFYNICGGRALLGIISGNDDFHGKPPNSYNKKPHNGGLCSGNMIICAFGAIVKAKDLQNCAAAWH